MRNAGRNSSTQACSIVFARLAVWADHFRLKRSACHSLFTVHRGLWLIIKLLTSDNALLACLLVSMSIPTLHGKWHGKPRLVYDFLPVSKLVTKVWSNNSSYFSPHVDYNADVENLAVHQENYLTLCSYFVTIIATHDAKTSTVPIYHSCYTLFFFFCFVLFF